MWTKRSLLNKINHSYFPIKDIWKVNHFYFPIKDIWKVDWFQKWDVTLSIMLQYIKLLSCWGLILCVFLSLASFGEASCRESHRNRKQIQATTDWAWMETLLQLSLLMDENLALADNLIAALQKTQVNCAWTPGPQELEDSKRVVNVF